jgi:hypothetical protein
MEVRRTMGVPSDPAQSWGQARDLVRYGRRGLDVRWPGDERTAVCRLWQLVTQRPVGSLACNFGPEHTVGLGEEVAQRVIGYQSDDLERSSLIGCSLRLAPGRSLSRRSPQN